MTRQEVYAALKKKEQKVIGVKEYPQGKLIVYQYITRNDVSDAIEDKMYFYFLNDTLIRFAPPEEWKEGAEKAIARRYNKN